MYQVGSFNCVSAPLIMNLDGYYGPTYHCSYGAHLRPHSPSDGDLLSIDTIRGESKHQTLLAPMTVVLMGTSITRGPILFLLFYICSFADIPL